MVGVPRKAPAPTAQQEWERMTLLPFEKGQETGEWRPAVPQALLDLLSAFMLPGDVLKGEVDPMGAEGLQRALGFATNVGMPGLGSSAASALTGGIDPNALGIFAGGTKSPYRAGDIPDKLKIGVYDDPTGDAAQELFSKFGLWMGPDKRVRTEIPDYVEPGPAFPDVDAAYQEAYARMAQEKPFWDEWMEPTRKVVAESNTPRVGPTWDVPISELPKIGELIKHPELFAAYPSIAELPARISGKPGRPQLGAHKPGAAGNNTSLIEAEAGTNTDLMSVLLHEIQHEVQQQEGFASGGNPDWMGQVLQRLGLINEFTGEEAPGYPGPFLLYKQLMGEAESRNIQHRFELGSALDPNAAAIMETVPPWETQAEVAIPGAPLFDPNYLRRVADMPMSDEDMVRQEELKAQLRLLFQSLNPQIEQPDPTGWPVRLLP